jgi:hypothetical protein
MEHPGAGRAQMYLDAVIIHKKRAPAFSKGPFCVGVDSGAPGA